MQLYEHSPESFRELIEEIQSLGFDLETASHYAVLIGCTPTVDKVGNVVVMEDGKILTRLKLKFFED